MYNLGAHVFAPFAAGPNKYLDLFNDKGLVVDSLSDLGPVLGNVAALQCPTDVQANVRKQMVKYALLIRR